MQPAISIKGLRKRFLKTVRFRDLLTPWRHGYVDALHIDTLEVSSGSIFGLLGPNGAGKTTLIKIICGLVLPDAGTVTVHGVDAIRQANIVKPHLAYVPGDERGLYWRLTASQNMRFFATMHGANGNRAGRLIDEALDIVGLDQVADQRVVSFSGGMKQRLRIAIGLLADPDVLLLDEPTRSLDPVTASKLWTFIKEELSGRLGKTVVIATHNMEEAMRLCGRVAVMHRGRIKACDSVEALAGGLNGKHTYVISALDATRSDVQALGRIAGVHQVTLPPPNRNGHLTFQIVVQDPESQIPAVLDALMRHGGRIVEVNPQRPTLTDAMQALAREDTP